jgi:hypothetical protein
MMHHINLFVLISGSDGLLTLLAIQKFDGEKYVEDVTEVWFS